MFRILLLQALDNLSDEQTEYQMLDRLSFMQFLGLGMHDTVPDARTIWLLREALLAGDSVATLCNRFDAMRAASGFAASGGQISDATFVEVPRQRNTREENKTIKEGSIPADWSEKKIAHKDVEARWTTKNADDYFGDKNHVNGDRKHKLIRRYSVTDASVHDSQAMDNVLGKTLGNDVWADSAYRSEAQEARLSEGGLVSNVHDRAYRGKPLTDAQQTAHTERSRVRARAEHVFGHIANSMNGCYVRTIGIARAQAKIGMECLASNISRFAFLMRGTQGISAS